MRGGLSGSYAPRHVAPQKKGLKMRGVGRAVFAAILLLIAGTLNVVYGIAAIDDANFFTSLGIFALCVIVIHGLVVYGEPLDEGTGSSSGSP
jgi:hypothetical protein